MEIIIPFSRSVRTANFKVSVGNVLFDEASKVAKWEVGKLQGDRFPQLTGENTYTLYAVLCNCKLIFCTHLLYVRSVIYLSYVMGFLFCYGVCMGLLGFICIVCIACTSLVPQVRCCSSRTARVRTRRPRYK